MAGKVSKVITESEPISELTKVVEPVSTKDKAGNQINPATEDSLAKLMPTAATKYAVAMTDANTEYSQALTDVKKFRIHTRDFTEFRLAYETGKVATPTDPYETVPAGAEKYEDNLNISSLTLYFASATTGKTAEVEVWS